MPQSPAAVSNFRASLGCAKMMKNLGLTQAMLPPQQLCLGCTADMSAGWRNVLELRRRCTILLLEVADDTSKPQTGKDGDVSSKSMEPNLHHEREAWKWLPSCPAALVQHWSSQAYCAYSHCQALSELKMPIWVRQHSTKLHASCRCTVLPHAHHGAWKMRRLGSNTITPALNLSGGNTS